jgi:DNA-binding response OmpR family regulator
MPPDLVASSGPNRSFPQPSLPPRSILIVEDDRAVGTILELVLRTAGHHVRIVAGSGEAREALAAGDHDLVLLDLQLPDGHGFELLEYLRAELGSTVPVVILSATRAEESRPQGLALGANDYMTKPFSSEEILAKVRRWTDPQPAVEAS